MDIVFIFDRTKLVRVPLYFGHMPSLRRGSVEIRHTVSLSLSQELSICPFKIYDIDK